VMRFHTRFHWGILIQHDPTVTREQCHAKGGLVTVVNSKRLTVDLWRFSHPKKNLWCSVVSVTCPLNQSIFCDTMTSWFALFVKRLWGCSREIFDRNDPQKGDFGEGPPLGKSPERIDWKSARDVWCLSLHLVFCVQVPSFETHDSFWFESPYWWFIDVYCLLSFQCFQT